MIRRRGAMAARRRWPPALLLLACIVSFGDAGALLMWRIDGAENRVYLLGSVHLLRESDYPLPAAIDDAYEDAETLVMELDMDDTDPLTAQALATELGVIADGGSLEALLGDERYARATQLAALAEIPLNLLQRAEPWYAAITVEQLMLMRVGFNPAFGIEAHLAQRAKTDNKEILGLETIRQQLEMLDGLPLRAQQALFMQTLEESVEIETVMDDLIRAWKGGDTEFLEKAILADMRKQPRLYRAVVVERNRNFAVRIEKLLRDGGPDDYLVVVGALHLIGDDGVPALLAGRELPVRRVEPRVEPRAAD